MSGGNLSGVYHFYTMAVTAAILCVQKKIVFERTRDLIYLQLVLKDFLLNN